MGYGIWDTGYGRRNTKEGRSRRTGRADRGDPIHKGHVHWDHVVRCVRRGFGVGGERADDQLDGGGEVGGVGWWCICRPDDSDSDSDSVNRSKPNRTDGMDGHPP
jgi:hypothetical protein